MSRQACSSQGPIGSNNILEQFFPPKDTPIFNVQGSISQNDARQLYRNALHHMANGQDEQALKEWSTLERAFPGLLDVIRAHEADIYSKSGQEEKLQSALQDSIARRPHSRLKAYSTYLLAQSYIRGKQFPQAKPLFETLSRSYPESDYGIASQYYLGELALLGKSAPQAIKPHWTHYIQQCPDCRFSKEIATQLSQLSPQTEAEHLAIATGLATGDQDWGSQNWIEALKHLDFVSDQKAWLLKANCYAHLKDKKKLQAELMKNLRLATNFEDARKGIDLLKRWSPSLLQDLQALQNQTLPYGGDYLLWTLSKLDSEHSAQYLNRLITTYPESDWAPESSWQQIWPLLKSGNHQAFIKAGNQHLQRFPHSKSAAKVLFWQGKLAEKSGDRSQALQHYQRILNKSPYSYYGFRALGRKQALSGGSDFFWRTRPSQNHYPPTPAQLKRPLILDSLKLSASVKSQLQELNTIGAPEDIYTLLKAPEKKLPDAIESWYALNKGDHSQGIRLIRDSLDERFKQGGQPTQLERQLLYPVFFPTSLNRFARQHQLDPYLAQALMREESYFNPLAVSSSNARGLMQLLPSTAKEVAKSVGRTNFDAAQLFNPEINIQLGTKYLEYLHKRFNGNSMPSVGAYNGGPNAMARWLADPTLGYKQDPDWFVEMIPYEQTRDYIKKVFAGYWNYTALYGR